MDLVNTLFLMLEKYLIFFKKSSIDHSLRFVYFISIKCMLVAYILFEVKHEQNRQNRIYKTKY